MARWALLRGGRVAVITEQDAQPTIAGEWVDVTGLPVGPGHTWDGSDWLAPAVTVSLAPRDFLRRFTAAEREGLEDLAVNGTAVVKRKLAAFKTYLQTGGFVELDDDYIIAAVTAMEAAGVIGAGRAAEILA